MYPDLALIEASRSHKFIPLGGVPPRWLVAEIVEHASALDEWMSKGGSLPHAWSEKR